MAEALSQAFCPPATDNGPLTADERPMPKSMNNLAAEIIDGVFERAAVRTGRTPEQLRAMAVEVFASMLHHSMETPGQVVLTASCIIDGRLDLEVGLFSDAKSDPPNGARP